MFGRWHTLQKVLIAVFAAVWLALCSHEAVCHCDHEISGNAPVTSVCLCGHHIALETAPSIDTTLGARMDAESFDYVSPHGVSVTSDIFRPPLANS
jgi:hypothetical protein